MKKHSILGLFAICIAGTIHAQTKLSDYAGVYAVNLGPRTFLVLRLTMANGQMTGTIERPQGYHGNTSIAVTDARPDIRPIVKAEVRDGALHLIAQNPKDKTDTDEFALKLDPPDSNSAQLVSVDNPDYVSEPYHAERVAQAAISTDWQPGRMYGPHDSDVENGEMKAIYEADQKARDGMNMIDMNASKEAILKMMSDDAARRTRVKQMLADDALHTGRDFERASFIFQHGDTPDDFLLAHTLAMVSVSRGNSTAIWIASATLDRYLDSIGKPQVYGTQFHSNNGAVTMEPYNRSLISDALRNNLNVPSEKTQTLQLERFRNLIPK